MRSKLLWTVLIVSLAANVAFLAGAIYTLSTREDPAAARAARVEALAQRLGLGPEQQRGLVELGERVRQKRQVMREGHAEQREAYFVELGKAAFDRARVIELFEQRAARQAEHVADIAAEMHAYLATLSPEQRAEFLGMARERGFLRRLFGRRRSARGER